jgi:hypothetical protein
MPENKAQGAIMRTQLIICHALLSDPDAECEDLGTDYTNRKRTAAVRPAEVLFSDQAG